MAILCRDLRLLFVMVPGTGCSVLGSVLRSDFGGVNIPPYDIVHNGRIVHPSKHNSVPQLLRDKLLSETELAELTVVANIRNPFDRLVTHYQRFVSDWVEYSHGIQQRQVERLQDRVGHEEAEQFAIAFAKKSKRQKRRQKMMRRVGFNTWVLLTLARNAVSGKSLREFAFPMLEGVDFALRNEALDDAINAVMRKLGVNRHVMLPRKNVTPGKRPYTTYWNPITRRIFGRVVRNDLRRFGYTFDSSDTTSPLLDLRTPPFAACSENTVGPSTTG